MKKLNGIVWGIVLVAAGILLGLNAFGITDIDIFFDGWWTLFIIVPCAVGLITDRHFRRRRNRVRRNINKRRKIKCFR